MKNEKLIEITKSLVEGKNFSPEIITHDLGIKIYLSQNQNVNTKKIFALEMNIYNGTLDYFLIDGVGDLAEHKYYDKFDQNIFVDILNKSLSLLSS